MLVIFLFYVTSLEHLCVVSFAGEQEIAWPGFAPWLQLLPAWRKQEKTRKKSVDVPASSGCDTSYFYGQFLCGSHRLSLHIARIVKGRWMKVGIEMDWIPSRLCRIKSLRASLLPQSLRDIDDIGLNSSVSLKMATTLSQVSTFWARWAHQHIDNPLSTFKPTQRNNRHMTKWDTMIASR